MKNKTKLAKIAILILCLFLISCTSVSEETAKQAAYNFIQTNVAFKTANKTITNPSMQVVNEEKIDGNYVFDIIATTTGEDKIKSAKFNIIVDKTGKVIRFNGNPTSQQ